jgi:hypothetical protein
MLFITITCIGINDENYEKMLKDLYNLENYIKEYIKEKSYTNSTLTHLITCYIRIGVYTDKEWEPVGGLLPDDLVSYITIKDEEKGTSAQATQTYREIVMPNGETIDFVHMFAVMNGIEHGKSFSDIYAHLVGWGSDTEQLLEDIMYQQGDLEYLIQFTKENYFRIKGGFSEADLISDLDGPILLFNKTDDNYFADLIRNYYNIEECNNRVNKFVELTFPTLVDKVNNETFRNVIYNIYNNDPLINALECKKGMRSKGFAGCYTPSEIKEKYALNQKAAVYVVSDYFFEIYKIYPEPEEEESEKEGKEESKEEEYEKDEEEEKRKESENEEKEGAEEKEEEGENSDVTDSDNTDNKALFETLNINTLGLFTSLLLL